MFGKDIFGINQPFGNEFFFLKRRNRPAFEKDIFGINQPFGNEFFLKRRNRLAFEKDDLRCLETQLQRRKNRSRKPNLEKKKIKD